MSDSILERNIEGSERTSTVTPTPQAAIGALALKIAETNHCGHHPENWAHLYKDTAEEYLQAAAPFMLSALNPNERYWEGRWRDQFAQGTYADGIEAAARAIKAHIGKGYINAPLRKLYDEITALKPEVKE